MPKLRYTSNSPFARKVRVLAHELGIHDSLELIRTELRSEDASFSTDNPLAKVPVWIADDGSRLFDSNVICEYLNHTCASGRLVPPPGPARWHALTTIALADGMAEAGMLARQEMARPPAERNEARVGQEMSKVRRGLDYLDREVTRGVPETLDLADIAVACSLGWIELRFGHSFMVDGRASLARWLQAVNRRESLVSTRPQQEA